MRDASPAAAAPGQGVSSAPHAVRVLHVVPGPARHGVTGHALALLAQPAAAGHHLHRIATSAHDPAGESNDPARELLSSPRAVLTHLHLTDRLLAADAPSCAELVVAFARQRAVSLTLHDLPQPEEGAGRYERRRRAYASMAAAAVGVIVASHHEAALLREALAAEALSAGGPIEVVPLPLQAARSEEAGAASADRSQSGTRDLAVFGFVYPGKGHVEAIDAAARLDPDVGVIALGALADGHEGLADDYAATARRLGRRFSVIGYLDDDEALAALRAAAVPVAPHRHVSASGSIGTWLAAGRRPLAPSGRYVDELEARCPGSLLLYGPGRPWPDLRSAAEAALADPSLTWLAPDVRLTPSPAEAAARTVELLDAWADARADAAREASPGDVSASSTRGER